MSNFVTIREFLNVNDAAVAQSVLHGHDIQTWLANENTVLMAPHYGFFKGGGVRLQVEAADEARALEVLADFAPEAEADGEEGLGTPDDNVAESAEDQETVQVLESGMEAGLVRGFLQAQGFSATVQSPKTGGFRGLSMADGFMVNVPASEADEARAALESLDTAELELDAAVDAADGIEDEDAPREVDAVVIPELCPNCGSERIFESRVPQWMFMLGLVLTLGLTLLLPHRNNWSCADCGWEWSP